jgi:hypothetical protein
LLIFPVLTPQNGARDEFGDVGLDLDAILPCEGKSGRQNMAAWMKSEKMWTGRSFPLDRHVNWLQWQ